MAGSNPMESSWTRGAWVPAVVVADLLLWKARLGLSAAAAGALALCLATRGRPRAIEGAGVVLLAAGAAASLSLAVEPGPLAMVVAVSSAVTLALRGALQPGTMTALVAIAAPLSFAFVVPWQALISVLDREESGPSRTLRVVPWLAPAGIAATFAGFFAVGDAHFAELAGLGLRWLAANLLPTPSRVAWWISLALLAWGLARAVLPGPLADGIALLSQRAQGEAQAVTRDVVLRTLALVHVVFAVENAVAVAHAWNGHDGARTLAEAARHGAWMLLVAALVSAILVLVAFAPGRSVEADPLARGLAIAWLGQAAIVLGTAMLQVRAYVAVYGLTRMRLAAIVAFALIATGIALIAMRLLLRRDNAWLVSACSVALLIAALGACFTDVDGRIAWFDVRHCAEMGGPGARLDVAYLHSLGEESIPALEAAGSSAWGATAAAEDLRLKLREEASDLRSLSVRRLRLSRS